jgi:hypothetical protein
MGCGTSCQTETWANEFAARRVKERQDLSDDDEDDEFRRVELSARVVDKLTACLDTGSGDDTSVLIVALLASGLVSAPPSTTLLSESAALKKGEPIMLPWSMMSPGR